MEILAQEGNYRTGGCCVFHKFRDMEGVRVTLEELIFEAHDPKAKARILATFFHNWGSWLDGIPVALLGT